MKNNARTRTGAIAKKQCKMAKKNSAPPLGIEPRTCRLTADRSANGALEAVFLAGPKQRTGKLRARGDKKKKRQKEMNPEGFEPPTFESGIRRAAVAPWVRGVIVPRQPSAQTGPNSCGNKRQKLTGRHHLGSNQGPVG